MTEKRSVNLCSVYILPLLGLNKLSFGTSERFITSYVSEDDLHVVVECTHPYTAVITNHPNFKFSMEKDGKYFAVFNVPEFYLSDVKKFRKGKYSQFSESAKQLIIKKSGLAYRRPTADGKFSTDLKLLALTKDKELKKHWETLLQVKIDDDAELASIPGEDNFYRLELSDKLEAV